MWQSDTNDFCTQESGFMTTNDIDLYLWIGYPKYLRVPGGENILAKQLLPNLSVVLWELVTSNYYTCDNW